MKYIRETSNEVADLLIQMSELKDGVALLEPSAGNGKILDRLKETTNFDMYVNAIELNEDKCAILKNKGYVAQRGDFLIQDTKNHYNRVIACPPFNGNVDLLHIQKMYECLKTDGILVSLTSPLWVINNEKHQVEFRQWLTDKKYIFKMLPDNSFMEKDKTVHTGILKIWK